MYTFIDQFKLIRIEVKYKSLIDTDIQDALK